MTEFEHLVDLEKQGWRALTAGRAGDHYREHLTDDALMAFPFGVLSRAQAIAAMESAAPWSWFDIQDPQVVALTPDSGVVLYRVTAQRAGQEPWTATISSTFVRRGGAWKLAFHQQSPAEEHVPATPHGTIGG